ALTDAEIRSRADLGFSAIDLYKPVAVAATETDVYQAPMLYREHPQGESSIDAEQEFGAVTLVGGALSIDVRRPTVYTVTGTVEVAGKSYRQRSFLWFRLEFEGQGIGVQGLRMTYDSEGFPAIIELLEDSSGKVLFYVSKSLEELASASHGTVLEGRTFCVEPSVEERPDVLVVHLMGQGPQSMGPIVYESAQSSDLTDVHCRCEPSKIETISASVEYALVPLAALGEDLTAVLSKAFGWSLSQGAIGFPAPDWPFRSLRLPPLF
ncbi:MAG: hypothetical protein ACI9F9_003156, partial [Candidatus Paceibacteria bacterium]